MRITDDQYFRFTERADDEFDAWLASLSGAKRIALNTDEAREAYTAARVAEQTHDLAELRADVAA